MNDRKPYVIQWPYASNVSWTSQFFFSMHDLSNFDFWQLPEHCGRKGCLSAFSWCGICCWQAEMTNTWVLWPNVFAIVFIRLWDVLPDIRQDIFDNLLQHNKWIKYQKIKYFMSTYMYVYFDVSKCWYISVWFYLEKILQFSKPMLYYCNRFAVTVHLCLLLLAFNFFILTVCYRWEVPHFMPCESPNRACEV